ncbi:uncharacterized protein BDZ99DRAFT_489810 [Mytilinidion resinicola]|uniref:Uncharacterized protein n=1 Tax=Mytilinidion resinicola TaxID=574789 RepID=A0A6A6YG49_9PEZI|nr:uncharacterized protein BDZ99DRAFT_489810 [Mytilinidion resinicola]KAF2807548.1 hypothetical protein BDZ99DRAFT_489810 [Mytilinidion resinicola]
MNSIWQDIKLFFGDGFVARSSPIQFNTHCCNLKQPSTQNDNVYYGVEINEDAMPLFSALGDTCAPSCSCLEIKEFIKHIEDFIQTASSTHVNDYSLHTGKNDTSVDDTYVLAGLRSENVHPDDILFMEKRLWRQYTLQYLEKIDPGLRTRLLSKTILMTQFRTITANTHGAAVALLAARQTKSLGVADTAVEMAAICDAISMDMAKEALGILQGEPTETTARDRKQLGRELRWLYVRCLESLDSHSSASLLRRFATSGLHFVPLMDRYRECLEHVRFPIATPLCRRLDTYIVA